MDIDCTCISVIQIYSNQYLNCEQCLIIVYNLHIPQFSFRFLYIMIAQQFECKLMLKFK